MSDLPEIAGFRSQPAPAAQGRIYEVWGDVRAWVYQIPLDSEALFIRIFTGRSRVGVCQRADTFDGVIEQLLMIRAHFDPDSTLHEPARAPGGEIAMIQPLHRLE